MNILNRALWIFTSPYRVFDDIRERRVQWWQPWIVASLLYMLIMWIAMPIQRVAMEFHPTMTSEQIDRQIEGMEKFGFVGIVMAPAGLLILTLIFAGISYIAVTMSSRSATFKQYFTLCFYVGIVSMVGQLVSALIVRLRGVENIASLEDTQMSLSLRLLAPDSAVARGVFSSIEFFAMWSLVLLVLGLTRIFGMSRGQSIVVAIILWIFSAGALVVTEIFAGFNG